MNQKPIPYLFWWIFIAVAFCSLPLFAATPEEDARAQRLFGQLRCVICEGQSLSDSHASLAVQMREHVRDDIASGKRDDEILAAFVERYGEDVLMSPPFSGSGLVVWCLPVILLLIGGGVLWRQTRRGA